MPSAKLTLAFRSVPSTPLDFLDNWTKSIRIRLWNTLRNVGILTVGLVVVWAQRVTLLKVGNKCLSIAIQVTQFRHLVYVCVGTLTILDRLDVVDMDMLSWWLSERQLPNGGLNGRPQKLEDVCYSFWVLSSLSMLNKMEYIDADKLTSFILSAQDNEGGGIADRPGNMVDVFHTHFGLAGLAMFLRNSIFTGLPFTIGLSLLGYPGLEDLDPVYCMPASIIEKMGLRKGWKALPRRTSLQQE